MILPSRAVLAFHWGRFRRAGDDGLPLEHMVGPRGHSLKTFVRCPV
jgi:hypothetical protein